MDHPRRDDIKFTAMLAVLAVSAVLAGVVVAVIDARTGGHAAAFIARMAGDER